MALPELILDHPTPSTGGALTTLKAEAKKGVTEIEVNAAAPAGLQGPGQFQVAIGDEYALVIGGANTTKWKLAAALASDHAITSAVAHVMTVESIERLFGGMRAADAVRNLALGGATLPNLTTGEHNVALGTKALDSATTANHNVAIGEEALQLQVTGKTNSTLIESGCNTAVGHFALKECDSEHNTAIGYCAGINVTGRENCIVGAYAAYGLEGGEANTALGCGALEKCGAGATKNICIGQNAGYLATGNYNVVAGVYAWVGGSGEANTALGYNAMKESGSASFNTVVGQCALFQASSSAENVAVGAQAMGHFGGAAVTGGQNVAIGTHALLNLTTGVNNVAVGQDVGTSVTVGNQNVVIGAGAAVFKAGAATASVLEKAVVIGAEAMGSWGFAPEPENCLGTIAIGYRALSQIDRPSDSWAIGYEAAANLRRLGTTGETGTLPEDNSVLGYLAARQLVAGEQVQIFGNRALEQALMGQGALAMGRGAMQETTNAGLYNFAIGHFALSAAEGFHNTAVGHYALRSTTQGQDNVALGYRAGFETTWGSGNIFLGYRAGETAKGTGSAYYNQIYIANNPTTNWMRGGLSAFTKKASLALATTGFAEVILIEAANGGAAGNELAIEVIEAGAGEIKIYKGAALEETIKVGTPEALMRRLSNSGLVRFMAGINYGGEGAAEQRLVALAKTKLTGGTSGIATKALATAGRAEVITVEAKVGGTLGNGLQIEVNGEEVKVFGESGAVLHTYTGINSAEKLKAQASLYVNFIAGPNYTAGKAEALANAAKGKLSGGEGGQSFGIFNVAPVTQPAMTGATAGVTLTPSEPPTTAAILKSQLEKTTYTGGFGESAYTISDVVYALKKLGWLYL